MSKFPKQHKTHSHQWLTLCVILLLCVGLMYIIELNAFFQDQSSINAFQKEIKEMALTNQMLIARSSLAIGSFRGEGIKDEPKLVEIKNFTYVEPKTAQLSLKKPYE